MSKSTTTDLLLMLFPNIIGRLNQLLIKFSSDFELASEKKKDKQPNYYTAANIDLLSNFPHSYEQYSKCVNSFVDIGKNSPDSAISVLLTLLPNRPKSSVNNSQDNSLYQRIRKEIDGYTNRMNIYDLIITLFFADCTAQILTAEPNTKYTDDLFEISYKMIEPFSEPIEFQLRTTIVKQFSVIFGLLSINNLAKILHNFTQVAQKSEPSLFFILHRFLHLSISESLSHDEVKSFFHTFNQMNPNLKDFAKYFPLSKPAKKPKDAKEVKDSTKTAANMWALALYSLTSQLKVSSLQIFGDVLKEIYSSALSKANGKTPHPYHVMLCSNIIMRIQDDSKKNFSEFLSDVIFKKVKEKDGNKYLQQSLQGFLIIIRGNYCSRTTFFWEWGDYNAMWKPGVEASHLYKPDQDQNEEDSFTNLFFQHFGSLPIEQHPQIVGDILFNFASRDFQFFIQSTIPRLIEKVGPNHAILCLQNCIQMIIDPQRHFSEWAQENPLNNNVRIDITIPLLFNPLKVNIFSLISSMLPSKLMDEAYCFRLTDSTDFPHFSLPLHLERLPRSVKKGIGYATLTVQKTLNEWKVNYDQTSFMLKAVLISGKSISEEDGKLIRLLEFVPRILNASDLINNFGNDLITLFLSASNAVSFFSIRIINQIFAAIDKSRIIIYQLLNNSIIKTTNPVHIFMLFQLLNKLFDLSLDPACSDSNIRKLVNDLQPTILYLLTFPYPEIRDLVLMFINSLTKFCLVYKIEIPFSEILDNLDPTISAVARYNIIKNNNFYTDNSVKLSIPKSFITTREAMLSQYEDVYRFFLIEISNTYSHLISTKLLMKTIKILLNVLPQHPSNYSSPEYYHYANILEVIMHIFPIVPNAAPSRTIAKYLDTRLTPFYNFPSALKKITKKDKDELAESTEALSNLINSTINRLSISNEPDLKNQTNATIKALNLMSAPIIAIVMDSFLKWLNDSMQNAESIERELKSREKEREKEKDKDKADKDKDKDKDKVDKENDKYKNVISSLMQLATDIIVKVSQSPDLNFALVAYDNSKEGFLSFIQKIESYLEERNLIEVDESNLLNANIEATSSIELPSGLPRPAPFKSIQHRRRASNVNNSDLSSRFDIQNGDMRIALNYTEIVKNFTDGLRIQTKPVNEGPIRTSVQDPWIQEKYSIQARRKTFNILMSYIKFTDTSKSSSSLSASKNIDKTFSILGKKSLQAIGSLVRFANIFDASFPIPAHLENHLMSIESKYERYLPGFLSFHRNLLLSNFALKMLTESPYISPHYFEAIAELYLTQIDDTFSRKLGFDTSSNVTLIVSQVRKVKMTRTVSRAFSRDSLSDFNFEQRLTDEELEINRELLKYVPRIIISCFLYLLHKEFRIRITAFKLIYRILPILKTIFYPSHPNLVAKMMKKVRELSPIFNSQLSIITPEVVLKLSKKIAKEFPFLSDIFINEIFNIISKVRDNSFISSSNAGVLIRIFDPFFKLQVPCFSDLSLKDKWPHKKHLVVFTPFSLMSGLLQISSKIDQSNIGHYLTIWKDLASSAKDSLENIVQYLLNLQIEENKNCISSIKMILLELAKVERGIVINALVSRLTYAYWFHTTVEGKFNNDQELPKPLNINLFDRIILTLTEIAQVYFENIIPHIPIIFNFVLLYYDQSYNYFTDLLLIIVSSLSNCPDKFTNALIPPSSLIWPDDIDLSPNELALKRFTASEISLRSFSKKPVSIMSFVRAFKIYLLENSKKSIALWAAEAARWASGCGDLTIAGRACFILSELMEPVKPKTLIPIIKSFTIVAQAKQNRQTHFYIVSAFHLFSAFFDKYKESAAPTKKKPLRIPVIAEKSNQKIAAKSRKFALRLKAPDKESDHNSDAEEEDDNDKKSDEEHVIFDVEEEEEANENDESDSDSDSDAQTKHKTQGFSKEEDEESKEEDNENEDKEVSELFMLLFQIAAAFLLLSEDDSKASAFGSVCQNAMSIITSFTIQSSFEACDIKKLLMRLASLASSIQQKESLYAAILSIFYRERNEQMSMISMITFCCFLPIVYIALAACNNIHPFSSEMDDEGIAEVIECLSLIAQTSSIPFPLKMLIAQLVNDPSSVSPDDFVLQACSTLSNPNITSFNAAQLSSGPASFIMNSVRSSLLVNPNYFNISTLSESNENLSEGKKKLKESRKEFSTESESKNDYNDISESETESSINNSNLQKSEFTNEYDSSYHVFHTSGGTPCFQFSKIVEKTAPYLCKLTKNANTEGLRSAVFAVVTAFLQSSDVDAKIASCYEPIVRIAASRHSSIQASEMLQTFIQKMPICYEVSQEIPKADASPILNTVTAISGLSVSQAALFTMTTQENVISFTSQSSNNALLSSQKDGQGEAPNSAANASLANGAASSFNPNSLPNANNNENTNQPSLKNVNHARNISIPNDIMFYELLENTPTVRKLVELTSDLKIDLPKSESDLESCLIIVPIDSPENWNKQFIRDVRDKLAGIRVVDYPFVWNNKYAIKVDEMKVGDGNITSLSIPEENHTYYSYLTLMRKT